MFTRVPHTIQIVTHRIQMHQLFVIFQLGAYEEDDLMHVDILWYNDTSPYTRITFYENLFNGVCI